MTAIRLQDVHKTLGGKEIIRGVSLDIEPREFVVFVGPSGSGKSTLLRLIAGLEEPTSGEICIGNQCVNSLPPAERHLAMVFQSYALYPHMTVHENLAFGLKNVSEEERARRIRNAAEMLQITPYLSRKPAQLSGGQRQRVAIGRAIARQPKIFLFDEPLSNLDAALRVQMRVEIARLHQEMNTTMVYVTHDQVEAMTLADKIVLLRDGVIEQVGTPMELYNHPRNLFVAGFLGSPAMNTLPVPVSHVGGGTVRVQLPDAGELELPFAPGSGFKAGNFVTLGIRPEHVEIAKESPIKGQVMLVESLGSEAYVHLKLHGHATMVLRRPINHGLKAGDIAPLVFPPAYCHLFDATETALARSDKVSAAA